MNGETGVKSEGGKEVRQEQSIHAPLLLFLHRLLGHRVLRPQPGDGDVADAADPGELRGGLAPRQVHPLPLHLRVLLPHSRDRQGLRRPVNVAFLPQLVSGPRGSVGRVEPADGWGISSLPFLYCNYACAGWLHWLQCVRLLPLGQDALEIRHGNVGEGSDRAQLRRAL